MTCPAGNEAANRSSSGRIAAFSPELHKDRVRLFNWMRSDAEW